MRQHGSRVLDDDPANEATREAYRAMWMIPPAAVARGVQRELVEGNARSREFIDLVWLGPPDDYPDRDRLTENLWTSFAEHSLDITHWLMLLTEDDATREFALQTLGRFSARAKPIWDAEHVAEVLRTGLDSEDREVQIRVAEGLVRIAPDSDGLVEALGGMVRDWTPENGWPAVEATLKLLQALEFRAESALPTLIAGLRTHANIRVGEDGTANGFMIRGEDGKIVAELIRTIGAIGPAANSAVPILQLFCAEETHSSLLGLKNTAKVAIRNIQGQDIPKPGHDGNE
jgi:hypothetical protein